MLQFNVVETNLSCSIIVGSGSVCPPVVPTFSCSSVSVVSCVFPPVVPSSEVSEFSFSSLSICSSRFSSSSKISDRFSSASEFVCSSFIPVTGKVFVVPSVALASPSSFKKVTVPTTAIAKTNIAIIIVRMVFVFPFIFYPPILILLLLLL